MTPTLNPSLSFATSNDLTSHRSFQANQIQLSWIQPKYIYIYLYIYYIYKLLSPQKGVSPVGTLPFFHPFYWRVTYCSIIYLDIQALWCRNSRCWQTMGIGPGMVPSSRQEPLIQRVAHCIMCPHFQVRKRNARKRWCGGGFYRFLSDCKFDKIHPSWDEVPKLADLWAQQR